MVLKKALEHMASLESMDAKSRNSLERVIKIWEDRGVYDNRQISEFKKAIGGEWYFVFHCLNNYLVMLFDEINLKLRKNSSVVPIRGL